jgi:hypothetical protein
VKVESEMTPRIAYVITPHGFGHAGRATAVMQALQRRCPGVALDVITRVPEAFFAHSLELPFAYHELLTDVGMIQQTPIREDPAATVAALDRFFPLDSGLVEGVAAGLRARGTDLVICDIAPLGIAAAAAAGVPSLLVENFTWDWIYTGYVDGAPGMGRHSAYLRELFDSADHRLQTEPISVPREGIPAVPPVSRILRDPGSIRAALGIPAGPRMVVLSMGGHDAHYPWLDELAAFDDVVFVVPGGADELRWQGNCLLLPTHRGVYHPDLTAAADALVGKVGYSTVAEVYNAGVPFGCVARPWFRESGVLAAFARERMPGIAIEMEEFEGGDWLPRLPRLLEAPRVERTGPAGADLAARFVLEELLGWEGEMRGEE